MALDIAKTLLETGGYTCVITDGENHRTSMLRGVKPLVQYLQSGTIPEGLFAADKVIGKATAFLYVLLRVKQVYAKIISESSIAVLQEHGIGVRYETLVPYIVNRRGDGMCPFEQAVLEIGDPRTAYAAILRKMQEMNISLD